MGCYNSKIVDAPIERVWGAIRNFHDFAWAKGLIETCENLGGRPGDQVGAQRRLNRAFVETLLGLDDDLHVIRYRIDDGPPPVNSARGYVAQLRLLPLTDGDRTFVEWSSSWTSGEAGVKEACDAIYRAGLNALAAYFAA
jgi:hypothetical protein